MVLPQRDEPSAADATVTPPSAAGAAADGRASRRPWRRVLLWGYVLVYGFLYSGWLFHECDPADFLQYSTEYVLFLCVMATGFLAPFALLSFRRLVGVRVFRIAALSALLALVSGYGIAAVHYYYSRAHRFDPFLQHPPPLFEGFAKEKPPDTFRIMALGGSTTRCATIEHPQRYPNVLRGLLQERYPAVHVEVMNAGMDWFTTKHCLIHYTTYAEDWRPDLIVFMEAINDLVRSFAPPGLALGEYNDLWSHYYGPAIRGAKPRTFEQQLFSYSGALGRLASPWFSQLRYRQVDHPLGTYRSIVPFRANLAKLIRGAEASGARIVLMTQPSLYKDDMSAEELRELEFPRSFCVTAVSWFEREYPTARSMHVAMQAFNSVVRETAREHGIGLIDADAELPKDASHFTDDVHYTVKGAARLAEIVAREIVSGGFLERAAER